MLGGDHRSLNDHDVQARPERSLVVLAHTLWRQRPAGDRAAGLYLLDPLGDQLRLDRLGVDLLHRHGRQLRRRRGDALKLCIRIFVAGPDPFQVQNCQAAELADLDCRRWTDHPVHRRREERELEAIRPERPGDVDVVGIASSSRRHDRDVIEAVALPDLPPASDLDFHAARLLVAGSRLYAPPPTRPSKVGLRSCL